MVSDQDTKIFVTFVNFVSALNDLYGEKFRSVALYHRLLDHTTIEASAAVEKNIAALKKFFEPNIETIDNGNLGKLNGKISYSEKVFVPVTEILNDANGPTKKTIYKHLLTLAALTFPSSKARDHLTNEESLSAALGESHEDRFLNRLVDTLKTTIPENETDPMTAIQGVMSSGMFTMIAEDMKNGMESGQLDLNRMLSSLTGMMGGIDMRSDDMAGNDNMITGVLGTLPQQPKKEPKIEEL